jgi:hypothetical protein
MTLWPLSDFSGEILFPSFYQSLKDGRNKTIALQESKLSFLESADQMHAHPFFWASAVCIGNVDPIKTPTATYTGLFIILLGGICLVLLLLFFTRRIRGV